MSAHCKGLILAALVVWATPGFGEIIIDRTRIIYPATAREVTVMLTNQAPSPRLAQVWIDAGDAQVAPEYSEVPFTITPPILRIDPGKGQALRIIFHPAQASGLASDKEAVYWLNVLGIRPTFSADAPANTLQLTLRTRIKLFLRPRPLPPRRGDGAQALHWRLQGGATPALQVRNPSAYHVTLTRVVLTLNGVEHHSANPPMISPHSSATLAMSGVISQSRGQAHLSVSVLDDDGQSHRYEYPL